MRNCDTTERRIDTSQPLEESSAGWDPDLYWGAPPLPVDMGDTPWEDMYPATSPSTTHAKLDFTSLEPFCAPAWVSPSVADTLASMFDVKGYLRDRSLAQIADMQSARIEDRIPR
jgi:hypothetical protein